MGCSLAAGNTPILKIMRRVSPGGEARAAPKQQAGDDVTCPLFGEEE